MKKLSLALASAVLLMGAASSASAGDVSGQFDMTLIVEAACAIDTTNTGRSHTLSGGNVGVGSATNINVVCNDQLPYVLEIDNQAGGIFTLTNADGLTLNGTMTAGFGGPALGSAANSEGWSRVGTGTWESVQVGYMYDFGMSPPVGIYAATKTATVTF